MCIYIYTSFQSLVSSICRSKIENLSLSEGKFRKVIQCFISETVMCSWVTKTWYVIHSIINYFIWLCIVNSHLQFPVWICLFNYKTWPELDWSDFYNLLDCRLLYCILKIVYWRSFNNLVLLIEKHRTVIMRCIWIVSFQNNKIFLQPLRTFYDCREQVMDVISDIRQS